MDDMDDQGLGTPMTLTVDELCAILIAMGDTPTTPGYFVDGVYYHVWGE